MLDNDSSRLRQPFFTRRHLWFNNSLVAVLVRDSKPGQVFFPPVPNQTDQWARTNAFSVTKCVLVGLKRKQFELKTFFSPYNRRKLRRHPTVPSIQPAALALAVSAALVAAVWAAASAAWSAPDPAAKPELLPGCAPPAVSWLPTASWFKCPAGRGTRLAYAVPSAGRLSTTNLPASSGPEPSTVEPITPGMKSFWNISAKNGSRHQAI